MKEKDPAFLFYSKDFYEGTRTMLPRERACLIDLMIYQHQHGAIPNDMERMSMYCSGIDEATLKATLEAKFKLTESGWLNGKLLKVATEREIFAQKQSENGMVGQFLKKAKATIDAGRFQLLKDYIFDKLGKIELVKLLKSKEATHEGVLEGLLKHLAIEDANENAIEDEDVIQLKKSVQPHFLSPILNDAYLTYLQMRKEKKSTAGKTVIASQVKLLSGLPFEQAMATLKYSTDNGYTGLFPEKFTAQNQKNNPQQPTTRPERSWNLPKQ